MPSSKLTSTDDLADVLRKLSPEDRDTYIKEHRQRIRHLVQSDALQLAAAKRSLMYFVLIVACVAAFFFSLKSTGVLDEPPIRKPRMGSRGGGGSSYS